MTTKKQTKDSNQDSLWTFCWRNFKNPKKPNKMKREVSIHFTIRWALKFLKLRTNGGNSKRRKSPGFSSLSISKFHTSPQISTKFPTVYTQFLWEKFTCLQSIIWRFLSNFVSLCVYRGQQLLTSANFENKTMSSLQRLCNGYFILCSEKVVMCIRAGMHTATLS